MSDQSEEEADGALGGMRDAELNNVQSESEEVQALENLGSTFKKGATPSEVASRKTFNHLWLVSYSDFMTIMMIFFLGMYGYTVMAKSALIKQQKKVTYTDFSKMISEIKGPLGESMQVQERVGKVVLQLPEQVLFLSGQSSLNPAAKRTLEEVANSLKLVDGDIVVEGHTDDVAIRGGRYRSNWELSAARSFSVIEALAKSGVPQERLAAWGFGENRPLEPNTTAAGRAKNRRIEIVVLKKGTNNI